MLSDMFMSGIILWNIFMISTCTAIKYAIPNEKQEKNNNYWYELGMADLDFAVNRQPITSVAKNVIIFLGDGMGITMTTAGRIFKGQKLGKSGEEEHLVWEKFPNMAQIKTYNLDRQVPDSAATATAFFGGVKGNYYTLGVNGNVKQYDCEASLLKENRAESILKWSQDAGKDTGIVTSARISHATPAAIYAHSAERYWESDSKLNAHEGTQNCKDISRQLLEDLPGKNINVILGGGRISMGSPLEADGTTSRTRNDSRNLVQEWQMDKKDGGLTNKYLTNTRELLDLDPENTDYILGLFAGDHLPYEYKRDKSPEGTPSLKELTEAAIKRLKRSKNGFFLMVEGGRIDHGLHDTRPHVALEELIAFEESVQAALKLVDEEETLVLVTADHSHVMTINGYPERGNDILGISKYEEGVTDDMPHTTLMFTNGFSANFTYNGTNVNRANVSEMDTRAYTFGSQSAVPMKLGYETHGGEDVAVYATGPYAHLFHRVHEQSYIAHVMGYASCVGPYKNNCAKGTKKNDAVPCETKDVRNASVQVLAPVFLVIFSTVIHFLNAFHTL